MDETAAPTLPSSTRRRRGQVADAPALPSDAAAAVSFIAQNRLKILQAAEAVCWTKAPTIVFDSERAGAINEYNCRRHFTPDELLVFDSLNWTPREIIRELGRIRQVQEVQCVAGTKDERQERVDRLAAAEEALAEQGPGIREQMARLERELTALEEPIPALRTAIENANRARERLRKLAPKHLHDELARRRLVVDQKYSPTISALDNELRKALSPIEEGIRDAERRLTLLEFEKRDLQDRFLPPRDVDQRIAQQRNRVTEAQRRRTDDPTVAPIRQQLKEAHAALAAEREALERELLDQYAK